MKKGAMMRTIAVVFVVILSQVMGISLAECAEEEKGKASLQDSFEVKSSTSSYEVNTSTSSAKTTDTSYTEQQEKIKERVKNSPKYTVPHTPAHGAYGHAK